MKVKLNKLTFDTALALDLRRMRRLALLDRIGEAMGR